MRALIALVLATAAPAAAQWGTPIALTPTLAQCRDPAWLAGAGLLANACPDLLADDVVRQDAAARVAGRLTFPATAQVVVGAGAEPVALASRSIREEEPLDFSLPPWVGYELDGNRVGSCDEYVFQRYWTWHRFLHLVGSADSPREAFERAFDPDDPAALGHRYAVAGLRYGPVSWRRSASADDQVYDPILAVADDLVPDLGADVWDQPKNDFFALTADELAMLGRRAADLHAAVAPGLRYYRLSLGFSRAGGYPDAWQWHRQMSDALADVPDAELRVLARRRQAFQALLAERRALRRQGHTIHHARVAAVDARLIAALRQAEDDGCLDLDPAAHDPVAGRYERGRCDWAPDDLLPAAERALQPEVEFARAECARFFPAPADVAGGYRYRLLNGALLQSAGDPLRDEYQVGLYLRRMRDQERYFLRQITGSDSTPRAAATAGQTWTAGSRDWVRSAFGYEARFALGDQRPRTPCDINPQLRAAAWADVSLFGRDWQIVNAEADFDLRRGRRVLDFELLGRDYLAYEGVRDAHGTAVESDGVAGPARGFDFHLAYDPAAVEWTRTVGASKTVYIVGIPFALGAQLVGRVGVDFGYQVDFSEETPAGRCEPALTATIDARPFAAVDAVGSVGPGWRASAGASTWT
ncbi:MAG: hypothetical protein R3F60_04245 [bacterium]